jgi:hypothetical protein
MSSTEQEPTLTPSHHYLVGRYVTHRPGGVHIEARCTCGVKLEGIGIDESEAIDRLWEKFQKHIQGVETSTSTVTP